MWACEHSKEMAATAQQVWDQWSDVAHWPEWNGDIARIEQSGPFAVGSTITMTPEDDEPIELRIAEATAPTVFTDEAAMGDVVIRTTHRVEQLAERKVRVTYRMEIAGPAADTLGPEIGPQISADFPEVLDGLAKRVESA